MGILKHFPEQITDRVPKVYFSCHKDDFDRYFKEIKKEITKGRNCAVFYDADYEGVRDEQFYFDLSQMNLFVMPITTRLLTKPNRALGEELAFAIEHKIPVLPLMQESGLEELYKQKFGDLQFLDKNSHELGAISYEEKLDKYLSSKLLNDETIKRIREEFDAQIFLSYRKKDRIHANRLMRLIHKNDFCRDIAIWYDEFLTPGENFNDNIRKALDKSGLFVLAVTPSLLEPRIDEDGIEHKNYIEEHEYPMAKDREREGKIAILPAELVKTDSVLLSQKYENIPDCVDSDDENALTEALLATAKKLVNDENDNSPEHNFLIGLAYLNGIDVEVDHARAREMIEFAANADYLEAIDKMIEMYEDGIGTERNYEMAIQWHERRITLLQKRYNENLNEDNADLLFWALIDCGDVYRVLSKFAETIEKYTAAKDLCEAIDNPSINTLRNLSVSYERLGDIYDYKNLVSIYEIYGDENDIAEAMKNYEKELETLERIAAETNTVEIRRELSGRYNEIGEKCELESRFEKYMSKAKEYYERSFDINEQLVKETGTVEAWMELALSYDRCGQIYITHEGNIAKGLEYIDKSLDIYEQHVVGTERDSEKCIEFSSIYERRGYIYLSKGETAKGTECYEKAIETLKRYKSKYGIPDFIRRAICKNYIILGDTYLSEGETEKAKECYLSAYFAFREFRGPDFDYKAWLLEQLRKVDIRYDDLLRVISTHVKLGDIYLSERNTTEAKRCYEGAIDTAEPLAEVYGTNESRRCLAESYDRLGTIHLLYEDDIGKGKEYREKSLAITEQLAEESDSPKERFACAMTYVGLAMLSQGEDIRRYLTKALNIMNALCEQCPDIAEFKQQRDILQSTLDSLDEDESE